MTDARVSRLVAALSRSVRAEAGTADSPATVDAAEKLVALSGTGQLGSELAVALTRYLNAPIRCSSGVTVSEPGDLWNYCTDGAGLRWQLALEQGLALELADAMIGGHGRRAGMLPTSRVKRLIEAAAAQFFSVAARLSGAPPPSSSRCMSVGEAAMPPNAVGGLCAVSEEFWWQLGVESAASPPIPLARDDAWRDAVLAAASTIEAFVNQHVEVRDWSATGPEAVSAASDTRVVLSLAGEPRILLCADDESMRVLASSALCASLTPGPALGQIATSIATAILRSALESFASELPFIAAARTQIAMGPSNAKLERPGTVVALRAAIRGRDVTIRWLVASNQGEAR